MQLCHNTRPRDRPSPLLPSSLFVKPAGLHQQHHNHRLFVCLCGLLLSVIFSWLAAIFSERLFALFLSFVHAFLRSSCSSPRLHPHCSPSWRAKPSLLHAVVRVRPFAVRSLLQLLVEMLLRLLSSVVLMGPLGPPLGLVVGHTLPEQHGGSHVASGAQNASSPTPGRDARGLSGTIRV